MTNIVFTPKEDFDTIYRFEIYKNIIYVRLNPFSPNIIMHLLPKSYDCSDTVLIFRDDMITSNNINITNDYRYYEEKDFINSYYQYNNSDRDRDNPDISEEIYDSTNWPETFCDFSYDISKSTKNFNNLQINAGYRYNNSTPFYSVHYTGVRDNTASSIEDRCTLIDANYDEIQEHTNNIIQYHFDENMFLYIPKPDDYEGISYADIHHLEEIGTLYHKKLKYINDELYAEEIDDNNKYKYGISSWEDLSLRLNNE